MDGSRQARYRDPLDEIWIGAARRIGWEVARTREAYAQTDGRGTIAVGAGDLLDPDDCLAQIIFHELCHALIEGEPAWDRPDWGLDNQSRRDEPREEACLRLQATLAGWYGLRQVLAATTEHRQFYDALPAAAIGDDRAARAGLQRAARAPFAPYLDEALAATARVVRDAAAWSPPGSLFARRATDNQAGLPLGGAGETCGSCAWRGADRRCRHAGVPVAAEWAACVRWEGALDCRACAACCRDAYDSVTVARREPLVRRHPELVVARGGYLELARAGDRCAALAEEDGRFSCRVYPDRPRPCRELAPGGAHCMTARRRLGLIPS